MFSHRFTAIEHILKASEIMEISNILTRIQQIEHGFQHIFHGANEILSAYSEKQCFEFALDAFEQEAYQVRMLATTILGRLAITNNDALCLLKARVSTDKNWRVQEMLAMRFANTEDMKRLCHLSKSG